ncbi:hypothetical protein CHUAL_006505 [Chamberlinius hualienensis]
MLIVILIVSLGSSVAQHQTKCDNRPYTDVMEAITRVSNCTYATGNFNPVCVEASLPALSSQSLCPVNSDGSINEENLNQILNIITDGLGLPEICNQDLNPILYPNITYAADQLVPKPFTGECRIPENQHNNITNIKNTQVSLISTVADGKAKISIIVKGLTYRAVSECKLSLRSVGINANISVLANMDISAESSFSITNNNATFTIDSINVVTDMQVPSDNNPLLAGVSSFFSDMITSFVSSSVAQQETKCDNRPYTDVMEAITGVSNCTYATENFNPVCVEASLPALNSQSLCPVNNDESINEENVKQILLITKDGLQLPEICDKELNPIFYPNVTFNANDLLPKPITGELKIPRNKNNNITNVEKTQISLINITNTGQAKVSISVSGLTYHADAQFKLKVLPEEWVGNIDLNISIQVTMDINAECTFSINKNNPTFTIDFANVTARPEVSAFDNPLLTGVRTFFTNMLTKFIQNSTLPKAYTNFIATIALDGIAASAKKCNE